MTDKDKLEKLKKLADAMYYAANYLATDASKLHKAMDEYHKFIIHECKEEPVSNPIDFEKELYKAFGQVKDFTLGMRIAKRFYDMGKNSQDPVSEDLEKEIQDYYNSRREYGGRYNAVIPVYRHQLADIARHFANWQKQQLMKDAVEATVKVDAGGYPYVDRTIELYDYDKDIPLAKKGDKYKVILIKEG